MDIKTFKEIFDLLLKNYLDKKLGQSKQLLNNPKLNSFIDYISTFVFSGWKRIRPYCTWLIYKGFGGQQDHDILHFSIIFELFHTMALIHDDIIDQSAKRHNVYTIHNYITRIIGESKSHVAEWQAILIWDLLLSWVYELSNKDHPFSDKLLKDARENIHSMIEEVILWQMIDVDMMTGDQASQEMIEKKNKYKTASYTFTRPMITWAILAEASQQDKDLIVELGNYLWWAFQVRDDLMDITLGDWTKSLFSDMQEWQQTYFTNYIMTQWSQDQKEFLLSCLGKELSDQQIQKLQSIFQDSWAIDKWKYLIKSYAQKAHDTVKKINFTYMSAVEWLNSLIEKIASV